MLPLRRPGYAVVSLYLASLSLSLSLSISICPYIFTIDDPARINASCFNQEMRRRKVIRRRKLKEYSLGRHLAHFRVHLFTSRHGRDPFKLPILS